MDAATMAANRRWTWPSWPPGLFEDEHQFHFDAGALSRATFDRCAVAVGERDAPVLLDNLVSESSLNLTRPDMAGVVAAIWAQTDMPESALPQYRWSKSFRANGFSRDGLRVDPPAGPIRLYRGCVPSFRYVDSDRQPVDVDDLGQPVVDLDVESIDTRRGMSWFRGLSEARSTLRRTPAGRQHGRVYTAVVNQVNLLAVIGTEVVVDSGGLHAVGVPQ